MTAPMWIAGLVGVAGLKIVLGLAGFVAGAAPPASVGPLREAIYATNVLVFGVVSAYLARGTTADRRAGILAVVFLLTASTFADQLILRWGTILGSAQAPLLLGHVQVEALLPFFFWAFANEFPRVPILGQARRFSRLAMKSSLIIGLALLVVNLVYGIALAGDGTDRLPSLFARLSRYDEWSFYHPIAFMLVAPIFPFLLWKRQRARTEERRRVTLLLGALALGSIPMLAVVILMTASTTIRDYLQLPTQFAVTSIIVYAGLLSVPFTTTYAVQVHGALDFRLVIRKAVQYALARYTVIAATATPFIAVGVLVFLNRDQPLTQLLAGTGSMGLIGVGALGLLTLQARTSLLSRIDRRFFREQYDAHRILHDLVEASKLVVSLDAFLALVSEKVDVALHVESVHFLTCEGNSQNLVDRNRAVRSLDVRSELAISLLHHRTSLEVDLRRPSLVIASLPAADRQWLADHGCHLLVPWIASDNSLTGLLLLGEKRSELPFTGEDQMLLNTLASSTAPGLERRLKAASAHDQNLEDSTASICKHCGSIVDTGISNCPQCATGTFPANVPRVVGGKFAIQQRIGAGGMGVVYRAEDLTLQRRVAIKTLPRVAPPLAMRLRREARAMAAVSHPNLATIYGVEFWHGMPMLIFEYLSGGNLAERLRGGRYTPEEAISLARILAGTIDRVHAAGILHRDIKPSNIGFAHDGTVKLLDFGLARTIEASHANTDLAARWAVRRSLAGEDLAGFIPSSTSTGLILGTVSYMAPEAIDGLEPDESTDIWSLCVVLYEVLTGVNPFEGETVAQTIYRIAVGSPPDVREKVPECPEPLSRFLCDALSPDRRRRPLTAKALIAELAQIEAGLMVAAES